MKNRILLLVIVSLLFDSCFKDDVDKGSPDSKVLKLDIILMIFPQEKLLTLVLLMWA